MAMDHISSGSGAPTRTPTEVGHHYIDLSAKAHYVSVGTDSSADWQLQSGSGATGNFIGSGSPEGVVTASPGARYRDLADQAEYVKTSGVGNTGWE